MEFGLASHLNNVVDIGAMLRLARLAESSRESAVRMRFAREVVAPLLAESFASKRVWVFGSASTGRSRTDSDIDILVEGGEGLSASKRLAIAYDVISSLDVPCGCDVVILTSDEIAAKCDVSFIKSMLSERTLVYARE